MTNPYVDPQTVHNPSTGTAPPAAWGDAVRNGLEFLARRPGCVVQRTAAQSIPNSALTAIQFTATDVRDTDGYHSTATNPERITVPAGLGGLYSIGAVVPYVGNATGARVVRLRINGATTVASVDVPTNAGTTSTSVHVSVLWPLAVGDYVEVLAFQSSGGALNTQTALPCVGWVQLEAVS